MCWFGFGKKKSLKSILNIIVCTNAKILALKVVFKAPQYPSHYTATSCYIEITSSVITNIGYFNTKPICELLMPQLLENKLSALQIVDSNECLRKRLQKKNSSISDWSGHYPARPTVERTLAIALKMSLLIFQNAKRKFAFAAGTITTA